MVTKSDQRDLFMKRKQKCLLKFEYFHLSVMVLCRTRLQVNANNQVLEIFKNKGNAVAAAQRNKKVVV